MNEDIIAASHPPTAVPTVKNLTESFIEAELAEEEHAFDAKSALLLNITLIACLLLAYTVKKFRMYYLPESAGALIIGVRILCLWVPSRSIGSELILLRYLQTCVILMLFHLRSILVDDWCHCEDDYR